MKMEWWRNSEIVQKERAFLEEIETLHGEIVSFKESCKELRSNLAEAQPKWVA